jgi:two-component system, NarL family, nitrate/nitrite response regulator NarL
MKTANTRIVIADNHPIFRTGLKHELSAELDFQVVGEAGDWAEALRQVELHQPDIMLLDIAMPGFDGMQSLEDFKIDPGKTRIIIVAASIEKSEIVKALQFGVRGVVLKDVWSETLIKSIRSVVAGQYWVRHEEIGDAMDGLRSMALNQNAAGSRRFGLTPREMQILEGLVEGFTNKEIARRLSISEQTVKHHVSSIFDKTGVSNRLEVVLFSINHDLTAR